MDNVKEKFFTMTDSLLSFSTFSCDCVTDVENIKPGEIKETVKMQALLDKPVRFAFALNSGLVRLAKNGAIDSDSVLTELLALPNGDKKALFRFMAEYGCLFPISGYEYEAADIDLLYGIVNRIKAVVYLMSAVGEQKKDYQKIMGLVLYLQLSQPIEIPLSLFGNNPFRTCEHPAYTEIMKPFTVPRIVDSSLPFDHPHYYPDEVIITDSIFSPTYTMPSIELDYLMNGLDARKGADRSSILRSTSYLYGFAHNLPPETRLVIEFLFHYQYSIAVFKNFFFDGTIEFYDSSDNIDQCHLSNFNDGMKLALIDIAKYTIRDEISYNLGGMYPRYDINSMSPAWEIQDLLTGIYMSIFFMRPGVELYRKCSNPNCNRMFLVNTTSLKRKYCSSSCRNATAQRTHRYRKQSQ